MREPELFPALVIRESRRYSNAIRQRVLRGLLFVGGMLGYTALATTLYSLQGDAADPAILEVRPLSAATTTGVYAGLGGVVVALQFGSRAVLKDQPSNVVERAQSLVQRQFIGGLAVGTLLASLALGLLSAYWYADFPRFDAVRILGPLLASTFLAFVAAETALLMESPIDKQVRELLRLQSYRRLDHVVKVGFPPPQSRLRMWLFRAVAFIAAPVACTALSDAVLPARSVGVLWARFGIVELITVTAYVMLLVVMLAFLDRQPSLVFTVVALAVAAGVEVLLSVTEAVLQTNGAALSVGDAARGYLGMWVLVAVVPFTVMWLATLRRGERSGFIVDDVRALLTRRRDRQRDTVEELDGTRQPPKAKLTPLLTWAWLCVLIFPFGVILGYRAWQQAETFGYRGATSAKAAAWTSGIVAIVAVGVVAVAATLP